MQGGSVAWLKVADEQRGRHYRVQEVEVQVRATTTQPGPHAPHSPLVLSPPPRLFLFPFSTYTPLVLPSPPKAVCTTDNNVQAGTAPPYVTSSCSSTTRQARCSSTLLLPITRERPLGALGPLPPPRAQAPNHPPPWTPSTPAHDHTRQPDVARAWTPPQAAGIARYQTAPPRKKSPVQHHTTTVESTERCYRRSSSPRNIQLT